MLAWPEVLHALSSAILRQVTGNRSPTLGQCPLPRWGSTVPLHRPHPETGTRSHGMGARGYSWGHWVPRLWGSGCPVAPSHRCPRATQLSAPMPRFCASVAQPSASFQGLRCVSQARGSTTALPRAASPIHRAGCGSGTRVAVPTSLHPHAGGQVLLQANPPALTVVPVLPGMQSWWAPAGTGAAAGSQLGPSSEAARSPLRQPADEGETQVRADPAGMGAGCDPAGRQCGAKQCAKVAI